MRSLMGRHGAAVALVMVSLLTLLLALSGVVIGQAGSAVVSGTITTADPLSLSDTAVAVVTIVDRSARGGSGVIIGQRRLPDPGATPIGYKVTYDPSRIRKDHSYVVFAAVLDGPGRTWQNADGVPVITGGPTSGVAIRVKRLTNKPAAVVPGQITKTDKSNLSNKAVAIAALLDTDSGRAISWTAISPSGQVPVDFELGYDPATVAPGTPLGAWAAIVDGTKVWEAGSVQPLVAAGAELSAGSITVSAAEPIPPAPTPAPEPTPVAVPNVRGLPEAEAASTLEDDDLVVGQTKKTWNAEVAKGSATKTDPAKGTQVPPRSSVDLFISKGPQPTPVAVPNVRGLPEGQAVTTLEDDDLVVGKTKRNWNADVPAGSATKTDPAKGSEVPPRSSVDLYISKGPQPSPVVIPDVKGLPEAEAVTTLEDDDLVVGEIRKNHNGNIAKGLAIKTDPAAGTSVTPLSTVDLVVSQGPKPSPTPTPSPTPRPTPVVVPDVKGLPEVDAVIELDDVDLKAGDRTRKSSAKIEAGSVVKTDPAAGTSVQPGTKVGLTISTGPSPSPSPQPVTVPKVRGLPEPDAIIAVSDAGLRVGERPRKSSDSIPAGFALSTDPAAGEKVPPATAVTLYVSSGPSTAPTPTPVPTPTPLPSPTASPNASPLYPTSGTGFLSGVLVYEQTVEPTDERQVLVGLLEEGAFGPRLVPVTQYVAEGSAPQSFVLGFDWAEIDPAAGYQVLAAILDGPNTWVSREGTPAITQGAPLAGLIVPLSYRSDVLEGEVGGLITGAPADLSSAAYREVLLIRSDDQEVIGYDAARVADDESYLFSIPFLMEDIDQAVPYEVVARVTDGTRRWTGPGVPVITLGAPYRVVVPVIEVTDMDAPASPSPAPTATP